MDGRSQLGSEDIQLKFPVKISNSNYYQIGRKWGFAGPLLLLLLYVLRVSAFSQGCFHGLFM